MTFTPSAEQLLQELGLNNLPETEKKETLEALQDHFNKLVLDTVITNLSETQLQEFQEALSRPALERDNAISEITSRVPGLTDKITEAIAQEIRVIKAGQAA